METEETKAELVQSQNKFIMPVSIIIAGIIIAGAVVYSSNNNNIARNTNTVVAQKTAQKPIAVDIKNVDTKNEPYIGNPNAPVTIAYWFDFQCPFCRRFEENSLPTIVNDYVKTGKVRVVFKDFQFLGPDSQDAGLVENAMWSLYPNSYKQWHDLMFKAQDRENSGFGNLDSIYNLISTKMPSLDLSRIKQLVTKNKAEYKKELNADMIEGTKFGIRGTPGFVMGNQMISGAQPLSVFTQIIDTLLLNAKK